MSVMLSRRGAWRYWANWKRFAVDIASTRLSMCVCMYIYILGCWCCFGWCWCCCWRSNVKTKRVEGRNARRKVGLHCIRWYTPWVCIRIFYFYFILYFMLFFFYLVENSPRLIYLCVYVFYVCMHVHVYWYHNELIWALWRLFIFCNTICRLYCFLSPIHRSF